MEPGLPPQSRPLWTRETAPDSLDQGPATGARMRSWPRDRGWRFWGDSRPWKHPFFTQGTQRQELRRLSQPSFFFFFFCRLWCHLPAEDGVLRANVRFICSTLEGPPSPADSLMLPQGWEPRVSLNPYVSPLYTRGTSTIEKMLILFNSASK